MKPANAEPEAEPPDEVEPGRHFAFSRHEVVAAGPGTYLDLSAAWSQIVPLQDDCIWTRFFNDMDNVGTMTKKRPKMVVGLVAACVGLALAVLAMLPPSPGATKANFDRVEKGMTRAEVEIILGEQNPRAPIPGVVYQDWNRDDGGRATIVFHDEIVNRKEWKDSSETLRQKLRRWLRL